MNKWNRTQRTIFFLTCIYIVGTKTCEDTSRKSSHTLLLFLSDCHIGGCTVVMDGKGDWSKQSNLIVREECLFSHDDANGQPGQRHKIESLEGFGGGCEADILTCLQILSHHRLHSLRLHGLRSSMASVHPSCTRRDMHEFLLRTSGDFFFGRRPCQCIAFVDAVPMLASACWHPVS